MDASTLDHFQRRATIIKAMAHPSRLLIIDLLSSGERNVGDLQSLVGGDLSTVSKHLAVLKRAGLVGDRKAGLQVYYRLRVPCIMNFFACVEEVIEHADAQVDVACCHR
ncbi:MAG TPA: metalloregulator ArsR/SmtB family transcription factor [Candidatus Kapabacteria bacterium]|nr:metalloregulator ArsR/SmtB family transcription factor [Candidatus Kapabacteria bacterium]